MVLRKDELEVQLKNEHELIQNGVLREENPLDLSDMFNEFLEACRRGDLRRCQELISAGVNINGKDNFDYTPLIVASLCGHFELVQLLLESGALAERNTFQGERCIYNALNDRIRNLLLQYDYSKSTDPLQPWASHIVSLLSRQTPKTSDISLIAASEAFELHKFILSSRTPYFKRKLADAPDTTTWKLPTSIPAEAFHVVLRYLYLGDIPKDLVHARSRATEEEVLNGIDEISKRLEIEQLWEAILSGNDRRLARQRAQDEVNRAQAQIDAFFRDHIVKNKMVIETSRVGEVRWPRDNSIFADCLLRADEPDDSSDAEPLQAVEETNWRPGFDGIPIGVGTRDSPPLGPERKPRRSVLFPAHKAMLIRSPYFETMFSGDFVEARDDQPHLRVVTVDCIPEVLEIILTFLYTERADCPLDLALELLYTSDMLFLDKLKNKAAMAISTLGSGNANALVDRTHGSGGAQQEDKQGGGRSSSDNEKKQTMAEAPDHESEPINIYDVIHAAWDLRVQRLEEFAARYLAQRLEDYIDDPEFAELIRESASRLQAREETDTIELLDDIRYYLSERFRLRFEDAGLEEMLDDEGEINAAMAEIMTARMAPLENGSGGVVVIGENVAMGEGVVVTEDGRQAPDGSGAVATHQEGGVKTLDGEVAEDEFASDAINYQILLRKIDAMLDRLKLDA